MIAFCRPQYEGRTEVVDINQMLILQCVEVYFKCEQFYKKNCSDLIANITGENMK